MLVKITHKGWEGYTGDLGMTQFVDGVSVGHMSRQEAYSLGSSITVIEIDEDGKELGQVSHAVDMVKRLDVTAPVVTPAPRQSEIDEAYVIEHADDRDYTGTVWTREALEEIAMTKGISGIREISDPLAIKGVSMKTLIAEILVRQPGK